MYSEIFQLERNGDYEGMLKILNTIDPKDVPYEQRLQVYNAAYIACYQTNSVEKAQYWLSQFEFADMADFVTSNSNHLFPKLGTIVATLDANRQPADNEVVVVYGNYPDWHLALPFSRKVYRHISLFDKLKHDVVEYHPAWEPVDVIYILNLEERSDRYYETLLSLASVGAPLHRVHHYRVKRDGLNPYVSTTRNHIGMIQHFVQSNQGTCLILEDDFTFIGDRDLVIQSLQKYFERGYKPDVCFFATSKFGLRVPYDDLLTRSKQPCTTASGYMIHREKASNVFRVMMEGFRKMESTGDNHNNVNDRYWTTQLQDLLFFKTKLGFQRPGYSNILSRVVAHLD